MRDWPAILADAVARNLSVTQVAREQGCSVVRVSFVRKRLGVKLPRDLKCGGGQKPKGKKNSPVQRNRHTAKWRRIFAEVGPGASLNEICCSHGVKPSTVSKWAKLLGYNLRLSDARRSRYRSLKMAHDAKVRRA